MELDQLDNRRWDRQMPCNRDVFLLDIRLVHTRSHGKGHRIQQIRGLVRRVVNYIVAVNKIKN